MGSRLIEHLPNGVAFGGSVTRGKDSTVDLKLHIRNGSKKELAQITLQTCAFLRAIEEFADYSQDNKFVHVADDGWIGINEAAIKRNKVAAKYRVGWRTSGKSGGGPAGVGCGVERCRTIDSDDLVGRYAVAGRQSTASLLSCGSEVSGLGTG